MLSGTTEENLFQVLNHKVYDEHQPDFKEFKDYFDKGNYSYPITFLQSNATKSGELLDLYLHCLDLRDETEKNIAKKYKPKDTDKKLEYNSLIEEARIVGREKSRFDEAKELLEKAIRIFPKEPTAPWGLASAYYYIGEHAKSLELFEKLIKKYPDNLQFQFEAGHVCLNVDLAEGCKRIGRVMEKTEAYDHYLAPLSKLYIEAKKPFEALSLLESYIEKFPLDLDVLKDLEKVYIDLSKTDDASKIADKIAALSATN